VIPGHEVVGTIEEARPEVLLQWGLELGDRVAIEPNIPCGSCPHCVVGQYVACTSRTPAPLAHGFVPTSVEPALWGGYAESMYLSPRTVIHRVPSGLDAGTASLFNVVANGFQWACDIPNLRYGQSVLVLGAGQRGIAAVAAARAAGAGQIIATGLRSDARRLEAAVALGADATILADEGDVVESVRALTDGQLVDVAIDCSAGATQPVIDAIRSVVPGGTVVLAGMKHGRGADGFPVDEVVVRQIRVQGALSASFDAYRQALRFLATPMGAKLATYRTHELPLEQIAFALQVLGGERPEEQPIYVSVAPRA
jgi:threonine dehydrogenase-like Zn-dependent dehydrogenase